MTPTNLRLDANQIARADALIGPVSDAYPWAHTFKRASLLRLAVARGLAELEREIEAKKVRKDADAARSEAT